MKKMIVLMSLLICTTSIPAQMVEDFESNTWGWSESVQKDGQAIITEGVMMLVGKNEIDDEWSYKRGTSTVLTSCYAPFDPTRDFTYKCVAKAKAINNKGYFGLIFNYKDDLNYSAFYILKGDKNARVVYENVEGGELIGRRIEDLKLYKKKNVEFNFEIKNTYDKTEFYCDNVKAMEVKYKQVESSGIGMIVIGKQTLEFDSVEIIQ